LGFLAKKKEFRPVTGGGAATGICNWRQRLAGEDEYSSLFLKIDEHMRERERTEREKNKEGKKFFNKWMASAWKTSIYPHRNPMRAGP
jgi:hypothetical protein